ncbi:MAG: L-glutamate gamma-semialdehyde dehydrogenase [Firmicutes bacterium]|nr:L-glutamate gamma-semialdehyde dehydrogenase [Bacillota bacterium]
MSNAIFKVPCPINEAVPSYQKDSKEYKSLKKELARQSSIVLDIPIIIGGEEIRTNDTKTVVMPHNHKHTLAKFHVGGKAELKKAIQVALKAKAAWSAMPFEHRAGVFLKAAELFTTKYRDLINASTMLGQSKNLFQAEIDAACELADFLRFNAHFAQKIYADQPVNSSGIWNRVEYRPLDGFVAAISPFNFTAIAANLCSCPAMLGNVAIWKPSSTAMLSNYYIMKIFEEAGLPKGVINFVPCSGKDFSDTVLKHEQLGGIHFTGSTAVFKDIWGTIGTNIKKYKNYPRIVGETGGKDFVFTHNSVLEKGADGQNQINGLSTALIRGAFEYQGQKCSAASRAYISASVWSELKPVLIEQTKSIKTGDVSDFSNFCGAVIDKNSFAKIKGYVDGARASADCTVLCGEVDDSVGYFVKPTVILTTNPNYVTMKEEIFGPVLTIYVYEDKDFDKAIGYCKDNDYALTGAIWGQGREILLKMERDLSEAAGNLYINDKCTGAVVGQQPFGGGKASGTNDKAGSILNLYRWVSARTIKETFVSPQHFSYPYMNESKE